MNWVRPVFLFVVLATISTEALASLDALESPAIGSEPPSAPPRNIETPRMTMPPFYDGHSFHSQWGLGATLTPASRLWYLGKLSYPTDSVPDSNFLLGIQADLLWRVHPRLTLNLSAGVFGVPFGYASDIEYPISLGVRVYLRSLPQNTRRVYLMPYLVGAFQMTVQADTSYYGFDGFGGAYYMVRDPAAALHLGGNVGVGLEVRYKHHFTLSADLRAVGQGPIDVYGYGKNLYSRFGLTLNLGLAGYFSTD